MDPIEKKRLANERRLKAIQEQKQRNQQNRTVSKSTPSKTVFDSPAQNEKKNNLKLFDSDNDDEEEEDNDDRFKIRPQFEGENGLQLLEMNSEFSSRFKLDERFKDDVPAEVTDDDEANEEKVKNIKILESVLGFEVSEKYPEGKNTSNKRQIKRFDPEDEKASKYLKYDDVSEVKDTKPRKKKKDKVIEEDKEEEIIPISKERYIEVTPNLKELFASSSSFSLTSRFQSNNEDEDNKLFDDLNNPFRKNEQSSEKEQLSNKKVKEFGQNKYEAPQKAKDVFESRNAYTFFINGDDSRLKEGVDFFMRPKPLDEIREEWNKSKDRVMELFRMKKRTYARGFVNKHQTTQGKKAFIKK